MNSILDVPPVTDAPHDKDDVLDILEDLVEIARDEEECFRHAAENATRPFLQSRLSELREERSEFVCELEDLERTHGKLDTIHPGSMGGAFYRAWIGIRSDDPPIDDNAVLEEVERGESGASAACQELLGRTRLPAGVRQALQNHSVEILKTRASLQEWQREGTRH